MNILTKKQLKEWIGTHAKEKQKQWLCANGVTFRINILGNIIVEEEHYKSIMGVTAIKQEKPERPKTKPKFEALNHAAA